MDVEEFRIRGKEMVDYICNYAKTLNSRKVYSGVKPGYLPPLMPKEAPMNPEPWEDIIKDIEEKVMPGVLHWQHKRFAGYFPNGTGYPGILADMLSDALGVVGFSWVSCPALTELEDAMMNWVGKAIGLPSTFLNLSKESSGGGCIQGSASDCVYVCLMGARHAAIERLLKLHPNETCFSLLSKLVAYTSLEAHSCVQKAALMGFVNMKVLPADENGELRPETLENEMKKDIKAGLTPFFVSITLGTTSSCAFDPLKHIGPLVQQFPEVWLHVDAAYGGSSFLIPENRTFLEGITYAQSININPNKFMLTCFDCSLLWTVDKEKLIRGLVVNAAYLDEDQDKYIDLRHWTVALSHRFRSLKLWFMFRNYGIKGLQDYVRNHCRQAKFFESLVRSDERFIVTNKVKLGLVCFRLVGPPHMKPEDVDKLNKHFLTRIIESRELFMVPSIAQGRYMLRFCVTEQHADMNDMETSWNIIKHHATEALKTPPPYDTFKASECTYKVCDIKNYDAGIHNTDKLLVIQPCKKDDPKRTQPGKSK